MKVLKALFQIQTISPASRGMTSASIAIMCFDIGINFIDKR